MVGALRTTSTATRRNNRINPISPTINRGEPSVSPSPSVRRILFPPSNESSQQTLGRTPSLGDNIHIIASQFAASQHLQPQQSQSHPQATQWSQTQYIQDSQVHIPGNQQQAQENALARAQTGPTGPQNNTQAAVASVNATENGSPSGTDAAALEDEDRYMVLAPSGIERARIQTLLDQAIQAEEEAQKGPKRRGRRYDKTRMRDEFADDGEAWSKLISITRLHFCRFIHVKDTFIPALIREAAGPEKNIEASSDAYVRCYDKILEWRKNWYYNFTRQVELLQDDIETKNAGYAGLPDAALRDAYTRKFTFEAFHSLMGTTTAVVDWRATLNIPKMRALYQTLFVYSLIYTHQARHKPNQTSRKLAKEKIRLIMSAKQFENITVKDLVLRPVKPPRKVRKQRDEVDDLLLLDETFEPFALPGEEAAANHDPNIVNLDPIDPQLHTMSMGIEERMEFIPNASLDEDLEVFTPNSGG
ncbi:hypothetical protein DFP73DRAFT_599636 [Morchella snyderi]|nr:hypothetical protein DFP73DRAFT_599636 [Morchella snyderi]